MRLFAAATGLAFLAPLCAAAQTDADSNSLNAVAFISRVSQSPADPAVRVRLGDAQADGGVFATPDSLAEGLAGQPVLTGARVAAAGQGIMAWRTSEVSRATSGGAVDSVRMTVASVSRTPQFAGANAYDPTAVDVNVIRGWPSAMIVRAGAVGLNVSPHAGFGFGSLGSSSAEAGATFRLTSVKAALEDRLQAMGVKNGSQQFGNQGRFYLFAAVRGQAVGLNMQSDGGALRRAGWSQDVSSALIGDGQVGVGWRKGGVEASMGYVHRGVHVKNAPLGATDSYADDMAALSFTYHPHW